MTSQQGRPAEGGAIEAVIFDWGGTLSTLATLDLADMWRLAARRLAPDREDEVCAQLTAVEAAAFERVRTDQRSSTLPDLLRAASAELGLDVAEVVLEEAATHYLDSWTPHIVHDPDALPVLGALRAAGLRTGLLSNTHWPRAFHEHFLERDGLASLLDVRLYTSEMSHMKPHPSVFREALRSLGVSTPSAAVFVGDRQYDDVWGASMSGLRAVWRRNDLVERYDGVEPDAVIDRLPELLGVVEEWGGARLGTWSP
jgi:putative hydrolase of the HAD superfamily